MTDPSVSAHSDAAGESTKSTRSPRSSSALLALLFVACAVGGPPRIDDLPMYGQPEIPRPEFLQRADRHFIEGAATRAGGREQASHLWADMGDEYMRQRNFHHAMRRYNQAWLLDPDNYRAHWGFARVALERNQIDEAIDFFAVAKALSTTAYQRAALVADAGTAYSLKALSLPETEQEGRQHWLALADENFEMALSLDPTYEEGWRRWAIYLCRSKSYEAAREKAARARELGARPLPESCARAIKQGRPPGPVEALPQP